MNGLLEQARRYFHLSNEKWLSSGPVGQFLERPLLGATLTEDSQAALELVLWSSVEQAQDRIVIWRNETGFLVQCRNSLAGDGLPLREKSPQEKRRNLRLVRQFQESGFFAETEETNGKVRLKVSRQVPTAEAALSAAEELSLLLTEKLGMEMALANLEAVRANVEEVDDANLGAFFQMDSRTAAPPDAIIYSELTQCIRCRNNWNEAIHLTRAHPELHFGFVFLNKSRANFKRRVFQEERPEIAQTGIVAPTAFFLRQGRVVHYLGTQLGEALPRPEEVEQAIARVMA